MAMTAIAAGIWLWCGAAYAGEFKAEMEAVGKIVQAGKELGRRIPAFPKQVYAGGLPVCMIKPFADSYGRLSMGVFIEGRFQIGYPWALLENTVDARNALLISRACRLPAAPELPACERRSDGEGRRYIVIGGVKVSPSYFIGVEDDRLERQLAAYKSSLVCQ